MAWTAPTRLKQFATDATGQSSLVSGTAITGAAIGDVAFVELGYGLGSSPTFTVTDSAGHFCIQLPLGENEYGTVTVTVTDVWGCQTVGYFYVIDPGL